MIFSKKAALRLSIIFFIVGVIGLLLNLTPLREIELTFNKRHGSMSLPLHIICIGFGVGYYFFFHQYLKKKDE